jgi:hypothetical protein
VLSKVFIKERALMHEFIVLKQGTIAEGKGSVQLASSLG